MASKQIEIIKVPDDDPDDFPDSGPQNPVEAQSYRDKIDGIMDTFSDLLADDCKDALRLTHIIEETHGEALVTDGGGQCGGGDEVNP